MRAEADTRTNRRGAQALRKATADNASVERRRTRTAEWVQRDPDLVLLPLRQRHLWRAALRHAAVERRHAGEGVSLKQAVVTRGQAVSGIPWFPAHSWSGTVCLDSLPKGSCPTPVPR
jgi:hypothetical protein